MTQAITPFLWFDGKAEEAANFYVSVFKNSRIHNIYRYGDAGPGPKGSVMTVEFELDGQRFVGLNGGPQYKFTHAVSFAVNCKTQAEVDELWAKLTDGGQEVQCGWLTDKFGLSWQIIPEGAVELFGGDNPKKSQAAMQAMFGMKKLDIAALRQAYDRA
jgi:predicted 3-demethylubiquinone-9 3-methyltransferase (glyoxalase superfamily)